jgi:hypothetical protein
MQELIISTIKKTFQFVLNSLILHELQLYKDTLQCLNITKNIMKNTIIAPSVLAADFGNLQRDIEMINASEADWFH